MIDPTSDPTAIRPCPFCGSNDIITTCVDGPEWNVMCRKCCSSSHWDQTEDGAIAAWNRRAPKQAEGVEGGVVGPDCWDGSPTIHADVPRSWAGKRVMVSLRDEADGGEGGN